MTISPISLKYLNRISKMADYINHMMNLNRRVQNNNTGETTMNTNSNITHHFTADVINKMRTGEIPMDPLLSEVGFNFFSKDRLPEGELIIEESRSYKPTTEDLELNPESIRTFEIHTASGNTFNAKEESFTTDSLLKQEEVKKHFTESEFERYPTRIDRSKLTKEEKTQLKISDLDRSLVHVLNTILEATQSMKELIRTNEMQYYDETHQKFSWAITQIKMMDNTYDRK